MKKQEINIIEAAIVLFMRYGVKRTGMNDIAMEAGIARQTLYNVFSSKNAVLQATIRLLTDRAIASIESNLKRTNSLGEQLDVIFKHIAIEPFDLLDAAPNSEEIVSGFNASSQNELAAAAERNTKIIARVLQSSEAEIESNGLSLDQFADFVQRSAAGAKYNANDRTHLLRLLAALKVAVLNVTGKT